MIPAHLLLPREYPETSRYTDAQRKRALRKLKMDPGWRPKAPPQPDFSGVGNILRALSQRVPDEITETRALIKRLSQLATHQRRHLERLKNAQKLSEPTP